MSSQESINNALKDLLSSLTPTPPSDRQRKNGGRSGFSNNSGCMNGSGGASGSGGQSGSNGTAVSGGSKTNTDGINPSQALIIAAMLAGVLEVTSVLVDRNQTIEIVLAGSLKRKTELEKLFDQIGSKPFDEVVKALLGRLGL